MTQIKPSDDDADELARLKFMAALEREVEEERSSRLMWVWVLRLMLTAMLALIMWIVW